MPLATQDSVFALKLVNPAYVIEKGKIPWRGSVKELSADEGTRIRYLSI
jgi:ABC-type branched-subunit amino acid transport system ATPase component